MSSRDVEDPVLGNRRIRWLAWAFLPSIALHGAAFASLGDARGWTVSSRPASEVSFETLPPPVPLPEPEPPEPEPEPHRPVVAKPALVPAPEPEARPAPTAAPLDLRGLTLTNDSGGFAMPVGNELPLDRPIGASRVPAPAPSPSAAAAKTVEGPSIVALAALGTRPAPPPLDGLLRQNYPADARRRSIGGSATVRARIDSDGVARSVRIAAETFGGFGEACRRTLAGSRWSPPRDAGGKAVSTEVSYTCRFKVEP
jgi:TonB family protein